MPRLIVMRGDALEQQINLGGETIHIGRGLSNEVILDDHGKSVSREHAEIRLEGDRYVLVDLQSQNGIWIAGTRMPRVVLESGVVVTIGPYQLAVDSNEDADSGPMTMHAPPAADATSGGLAGGVPERAAVSPETAQRAKVSAPARRLWYQQYQMLIIAGVAAVALGGGAWAVIGSKNRTGDAGSVARLPEPEPIPIPPPADVPPPPPPPTFDVTSAIQAVRQALSSRPKDCATAQEGLDRILAVQSDNPEVGALARDVANCRQERRPAPPPPVGGGPAQASSPEQGGLVPSPNETNASYLARIGTLEGRFRDADATLAKDDLRRALSQFEAIAREAGANYRYRGDANGGVAERVRVVRSRLKEAARKQFEAAGEMVRTNQFDRAVDAYRQAALDDPTLPVDTALERLNAAKLEAGQKACNLGKMLYSMVKPDEAAKQYDLVLAWLPPTDPCYAVAKDRKSPNRAP